MLRRGESPAEGPTVVPRRNQRQYCTERHNGNSPADYESVPLDWARFLWELQSSGLEDFRDITDHYANAINSGVWTSTGSGVADSFSLSPAHMFKVHQAQAREHGVSQ